MTEPVTELAVRPKRPFVHKIGLPENPCVVPPVRHVTVFVVRMERHVKPMERFMNVARIHWWMENVRPVTVAVMGRITILQNGVRLPRQIATVMTWLRF